MKHEPQPNPGYAEEELEVRLVAMVLGECSEFERARLEQEIAGRPDLARFVEEIAETHALLAAEAARGGVTDRLPEPRRGMLLEQFRSEARPSQAEEAPAKSNQRQFPSFWKIALPIAAVFIVGLFLFPFGTVQRKAAHDGRAVDLSKDAVAFFGAADEITIPAPPTAAPMSHSAPMVSVESDALLASQVREFTGSWGTGRGVGTLPREPETAKPRARADSRDIGSLQRRLPPQAQDGEINAEAYSREHVASLRGMMESAGEERLLRRRGSELLEGSTLLGLDAFRDEPRRLWEFTTGEEPVSTFSLHVADVSFRLAADSILRQGRLPEPGAVRAEEFTAAFDYLDPAPSAGEPVVLAQEQALDPFVPEATLLRLSLRVAADGRAEARPLNLVLLLDRSGSMERPDRAAAAQRAFEALFGALDSNDRVTLVTFGRTAELVADRATPADAAEHVAALLAGHGESGTNLGEALATAGGIALQRRDSAAENRLVVVTDGIANLGETLPESLAAEVAGLRSSGVATDIVAVGARDAGDAALSAMARQGDGRYFLLEDGDADAEAFARCLAGAFSPAARDVKVQVRFNPSRVTEYSLLGFDAHRLREEDFRDDSVDAAELAAAEQGTALYRLRIDAEGTGEVGVISTRFMDAASGRIVERSWVIPYLPSPPPFDLAPAPMRLAIAATLFAEFLAGAPAGIFVELETLERSAPAIRQQFPDDENVSRLLLMIEKAKSL